MPSNSESANRSLDVAVVGPGGVGGLFGARLVEAGHRVRFLGRDGPHLEALKSNGLTIVDSNGERTIPVDATADPDDFGLCDFVLFCVKSTDTRDAARALGPSIKADTAVVSFQNGVDNERIIGKAVGSEHVMGGVAYVFATIRDPGVVENVGGAARVIFGEFDGTESERSHRLLDLFSQSGIDAHLSTDINRALWHKYSLICAVAGMTAATRSSIGQIRSSEPSMEMLRGILTEVVEVAAGLGIQLGTEAIDEHLRFVEGLPEGAFSSLYHDMVSGKPMELETLHGDLLAAARSVNVSTPMSQAIYAILKPTELVNAKHTG